MVCWDEQGMPAPQEPCPRVLTQPSKHKGAVPRAGKAAVVDEAGTGQAGVAMAAS